jgi:DNA primase
VIAVARQVSGDGGFAVLAEQLRDGGELDAPIAEVLAEPSPELEPARLELAGAIKQSTMRSLRAEQDRLVAQGLPDERARSRYREISVKLERLRAMAEIDPESKSNSGGKSHHSPD